MSTAAREPAVAGRFYPGDASALARELAVRMATDATAAPALVLIGPHAGYVYSGDIAARAWARVAPPRRVVLLCPNHTGRGPQISVWSGGPWRIPGATIPIADDLRDAIVAALPQARLDTAAHLGEHAIEVHLPMLLRRRPDAEIVPIVLGRLDLDACDALAGALAAAIADLGEDVLVVASTDMSHYIAADAAAELDGHAIARILALDPTGLHATVEREHISMCGYVPTTVALACARLRGAAHAELVAYGNSGTRSGDFDRVVGYAALIVTA